MNTKLNINVNKEIFKPNNDFQNQKSDHYIYRILDSGLAVESRHFQDTDYG